MSSAESPSRPALPMSSALCLLILIVLIEIGGGCLFSHFLPKAGDREALWVTALLRLLDFCLILFFACQSGQGISAIGIRPTEWLKGIIKGLEWSFGFGLIVLLTWAVVFFAFHINLLQFLISSSTPAHFWLIMAIGGIFAPIVEDSFFVGCLYNSLRRKLSPLWSILGISILFALLHSVRGIPVTQLIGGLLFTLAFEYSANLLTPISIHILANCTLFTLAYSAWIKGILR
ncbi:MAG: CPBP family intramembrane glutamic endopeptidase [bacterium]